MNAVTEISDQQYLAEREKYQLVERRPAPVELNAEEREYWLSEYCDSVKYVKPTPSEVGHFVVVDCEGRETIESNYADAVNTAIAKFNEGNHP